MARKSGADLLLQLLDEVRAMQTAQAGMQTAQSEMQKAQVEMQKAQTEMQHALHAMGTGLNRAARLISSLAGVTGKNEQRLENHESRLRALEHHAD